MSDKLNNILFDLRISYSTRTRMSKVARMQTWNNAQDAYLGRDASSFLFFCLFHEARMLQSILAKDVGWSLWQDATLVETKCVKDDAYFLIYLNSLGLFWVGMWLEELRSYFRFFFYFWFNFSFFFSFQFFHSEITALTFAFLVFKNAYPNHKLTKF